MREEGFQAWSECYSTVDENWTLEPRGGFYQAGAELAKEHLTGKCLVIGSALFEAEWLKEKGLSVTYADLRKAPFEPSVVCNAVDLPFPDESFDSVSTTNVITHVGTGRYGDDLNTHGDEVMLSQIERVLKKGGKAHLGFGPCSSFPKMVRVGRAHRVYTEKEARRMLSKTSLKVEVLKIYGNDLGRWLMDWEEPRKNLYNTDFISAIVTKT